MLQDELLWAAAWLFEATEDRSYLEYLAGNGEALGGTGWSINQFGWDVKYPGVQVLAAKFLLQGRAGDHAAALQRYRQNAEFFVCSCVGKGAVNVARTPGGMMYHQRWNNLQFVTSASFLLTVYADFAAISGRGAVHCPAGAAQPFDILKFVKSQVKNKQKHCQRPCNCMVFEPVFLINRVNSVLLIYSAILSPLPLHEKKKNIVKCG